MFSSAVTANGLRPLICVNKKAPQAFHTLLRQAIYDFESCDSLPEDVVAAIEMRRRRMGDDSSSYFLTG
jgi:hypothetical protein